ncbi:TPA: DUF1471 family periplasmic protein McbA [Citrobacter freundii]
MKKWFTLIAAALLTGVSFTSYAAPSLVNPESGQLKPAGTVSARGANSLDELEDRLAEKAREEGAKGFVVTSAGGDNQMYGTATIYK